MAVLPDCTELASGEGLAPATEFICTDKPAGLPVDAGMLELPPLKTLCLVQDTCAMPESIDARDDMVAM